MDSEPNTVRSGPGSLVFSYVANRGALVAVAVTLLLLVVRPAAALVGGALMIAYLFGGYDLLYHALRRRTALGPLGDLAARTVLLLAGVLAVPVTLVEVGLASEPLRATAVLFRLALGVLLLVAGVLVTVEGLGLLRGRLAVFSSTPYVGQEVDGGDVITVEGEAERVDDDDRVMTDGGRQRRRERDPFTGTEFESAAPDGQESDEHDHATPGEERPEFASTLFAAVREGRPVTDPGDRSTRTVDAPDTPDASAAVTVDASMVLDRATGAGTDVVRDDEGLPHVDAAAIDGDPVAVDADTGEVVTTRGECTPDAWRAAVVDWLVEGFERRHGVDLRERPAALNRLQAVATRTREDLARRTRTEILLPFVAEVDGATVHLRRSLAAVGPDGRRRSTPPFGETNPVDHSRDLVDRVPSGDGDDSTAGRHDSPETTLSERPGADATSEDATVLDSTATPHTASTTEEETTAVDTAGLGTATAAGVGTATDTGVEDTSPEVSKSGDGSTEEGRRETPNESASPEQGAASVPVAPHTGVETVYHRRRRRTKIARPRPLAELPVDPGRRVDDLVPESVPLGELLPSGVGDRVPTPELLSGVAVPARVSVPGVPDVFEDGETDPGVRTLAAADSSSAPFRVYGFGEVTVEPDGLRTVAAPDASGADGPGFWYETRVQPGDEVTVLGYAEEHDGTTTMRGGVGPFVVGRGDEAAFASTLTRGGLVRVGAGAALVAAGVSLATPVLPGSLLLVGAGVGVAALSARRGDTTVTGVVRRVADRLPGLDRD